jgi:hypothetical protein
MSRLPKADPEHCQALTLGETQNLHRFGGGCVFSQVLVGARRQQGHVQGGI